MEDYQIIDMYWQRDESAITETDRKYGAYCRNIADNILQNKEDSEECVNDTWLKVWNSIPPTKPGNFRMYLAKIIRNLSFNKYNANVAKKRGGGEMTLVLEELAESIADNTDVEKAYEAKELGVCIRKYVGTLPKRERNIFVRRYFFVDSAKEIAERYGLTENNIMVILSRTRKDLKKYLQKEGYMDD
jgi:RNA polymerase sigma-70 factor (ECF subfamily)